MSQKRPFPTDDQQDLLHSYDHIMQELANCDDLQQICDKAKEPHSLQKLSYKQRRPPSLFCDEILDPQVEGPPPPPPKKQGFNLHSLFCDETLDG